MAQPKCVKCGETMYFKFRNLTVQKENSFFSIVINVVLFRELLADKWQIFSL